MKVLEDLEVLSAEQLGSLSEYGLREQTNWRGIDVGELRPCFRLHLER